MRVISAPSFGPPHVLRIEERPIPDPKAGEVIVEAAGVNLMDSYLRHGMHPSAPLPLALAVEGAGVVIAAGDQSTAKIGDRVAWERVPGSYAEMVAVPAERLVLIPESVTFEQAAGGLMQGLTEWKVLAGVSYRHECVRGEGERQPAGLPVSRGARDGAVPDRLQRRVGARPHPGGAAREGGVRQGAD